MKKYLLILVTLFFLSEAKAQSSLNYAAFGIGVSISRNRPYADTKRVDDNMSYAVTGNYFFTPYVPIGLEFQFGTLSGGGRTRELDAYGRTYKNDYKALLLHMDVQLGEVINYQGNTFLNLVKNFYAGAGLGGIYNNMADIQRENLFIENGAIGEKHGFEGKDSGLNFMVPLRFGYEFKIYNGYDQPNIRLDIGYQHNLTFGEGLDGYNDPSTKFKNNALDQYRQITVGIKVNFAGERSYDKEIKGY
ncbi:porin family protein [Mucilaginibacter achroorhodeus]|uniref:porin family protein n=1 Tax=Mucilaginibacter achroorhodeus TaxID=2599294 RepID=UPI0021BD27A1|nr:porin family protein [Mucilaginibacter achroorhodeus]